MKQTFLELLHKSDLKVSFLPDVIICCSILHNVLLGQSNNAVEQLFQVLGMEDTNDEIIGDEEGPIHDGGAGGDEVVDVRGHDKRSAIAQYLAAQRNIAMYGSGQ